MRDHVRILGVLNIVWGSLGVIGALFVLLIFGGALGLVGIASHQEPEAAIAVPIIGLIGGAISLIILVTSIPAIVAGIGLLRMASWSRTVGIFISALHLLGFPFGTALGIYGLWVLMSNETAELFVPSRGPVNI
jgi:hypothetical protein